MLATTVQTPGRVCVISAPGGSGGAVGNELRSTLPFGGGGDDVGGGFEPHRPAGAVHEVMVT
jgi:hypothetical protein